MSESEIAALHAAADFWWRMVAIGAVVFVGCMVWAIWPRRRAD